MSIDDRYSSLMTRLNAIYESGDIDYDSYNNIFDTITSFYEGKVVNNIPRAEAKKAGNYGKDKLSNEEDLKHYKKRLYRATSGSPLTYANRKLDEYLAPTDYDKEQAKKRGGEGRKFKLTDKDVKKIADSKGKDLAKAVYKGAVRDTVYDVAKQKATTFGSIPGVPMVGASIGSLNQNLGTYTKLAKVGADAIKKIDESDLSENDKKVLKTKARLLTQRYLKQHSNSKNIEDKYMIDLGKSINRELYGKTSSLSEFKKMTKDIESKAKDKENQSAVKDAGVKTAKKIITREIPDKEGVKDLADSAKRAVTSVSSAAYHGSKLAGKVAGKKLTDAVNKKQNEKEPMPAFRPQPEY